MLRGLSLRVPRARARSVVASGLAVGLLLTATACGGSDDETATGLAAVDISGEVGEVPKVEWTGDLAVDEEETETLVEGDGAELADGDGVLVNFWVGNGYNEQASGQTYGKKVPGAFVTVGEEPQVAQAADEQAQALEVLKLAVAGAIEPGMTVGSRIAVAVNSEDAFGEAITALAPLDIGNEDPLVLVVDLVGQPLEAPEGQTRRAPDWVPPIVLNRRDLPTGFDFDGLPEPSGELRVATIIAGEGEEVESGQLMVANYLGEVYGGEEPFDESYTSAPRSFPIGLGSVVKGWDRALVGVPVGSRVVLEIPPALGYGEQGNEQAGISGTDTLYFVIDVLGAV